MSLEELARQIVDIFVEEDKLYDPDPRFDGYTFEDMVQHLTEEVLALLRSANVRVG